MSCDCCLSTLSGTAGSVIACILERLWNPVERQVLYLVRYKSNLKTFRDRAGELEALKSDVLMSMKDADDKGEEIKAEVLNWHVQTIQFEMDVEWLEEKIEKTKGSCHMWHLDWRSRHRLSRLAKKKTDEIVDHHPRGKFENGVSFPARPADLRSLPTSDFVPLETMWKAIHSIIGGLKDEKNKIIGVHGKEAKSCLQFSCLFPAYYHVSMEELVIHGLVDRLFPGDESLEEVWNKMDSVVAELMSSNLLLVDDKEGFYRIHDDTRKVIKFIADNIMAEAGLRKGWPEEEDLRECRKLSLMDSNVTLLPADQPECPQLTTLFLQNNVFEDIPTRFFEHMRALNFLDLSYTGISSLPLSFQCLEKLSSLRLENTHLRDATLIKEFEDLQNTNVLSIDFDGPWRNLKRFRICVNDDYWDIASTKSMHLKNLSNPPAKWVKLLLEKTEYLTFTRSKNLEDIGKIDVQGLTRWICFHLRACSIDRVFSLGFSAMVSNLEELHVEYCYSLKEVFYLEEIEEERSGLTRLRELILVGLPKLMSIWKGNHEIAQLENLKMMKVKDCGKLRNIFSKTLAQKLHTLEHLAILKCVSLEEIVSNDNAEVGGEAVQQMDLSTVPPLFFFQNLQKLLISKCNKMESVLPLTNVQCLNLLEELTVDSCNQVQRIITASSEVREAECKNMLPKLKILALNDLPKLETVCNGEIVFRWPALQELHVWDCPNLKKLPLDSRSAPKMRKVRGQSSWFEDLQLKDEYAKTRLQPLLTEEE
ncbi:hypothetical protein LWI28_003573 [Acer negundo]|uniref:Disease resistance protein At4g27190-like leucine-rich repeats domain-containing protein n=1 Tax=Acer negundo TaxID=4023 RepID=A0AAD5J3V8_ACENE|nr:hypothetical protein LWI28_003573 [Acer negundo]